MTLRIELRVAAAPLRAALDELAVLLDALPSPLELQSDLLSAELRQFLVDAAFDLDHLVRIDSNQAADGARDVLVAFQPSDLLLELSSALRAMRYGTDNQAKGGLA